MIIGISAAVVTVACVCAIATAPRIIKRPDMKGLVVNYAHRGLFGEGAPENSLEAFKRAVDAGYGIELDVRESADGTVYVFHDDTLTRMCGVDKKFCQMHDEEIDALRLGDSDSVIPRFSEVLSLVDGKIPLLVELKGDLGDKTLCSRVAPLLDGYSGAYCVESFNPFLLRWFKKNRPRVVRGQLYTDLKESNPKLRAVADSMVINAFSRPDFIAYDERFDKKPILRLCLNIFKPKRFVWTVRTEESKERHEKNKKVDAMIFESVTPSKVKGDTRGQGK